MNSKLLQKTLLLLCILSFSTKLYGQEINIIPPKEMGKTFEGGEYEARIDFISNSPELFIEENNGTPGKPCEQRADGKYIYTFICDVADTNKFGFIISLKGSASSQNLTVVLQEKEHREYQVETEDIPASISEVKIDNMQVVVPKENTAMATITSQYPKLVIRSVTGETAEGPVYNEEKKQFIYTVTFDLSDPAARDIKRVLKLSVNNNDFVEQDLGQLSPKQGVDISVIVIQESCYRSKISQANNCFLNGAYLEAWNIYKKIVETDECPDKPQNLSDDKTKLKEMHLLAAAFLKAKSSYEKASGFESEGQQDSCMFYHQEAYKYRNFILKRNPSDPYCLEYNRLYEKFKDNAQRVVSGRVVDNARMDANNRNLPIEGVYIVQSVHRRDTKEINKVSVPWYGNEIDESRRELLGKTDADGNFTVHVKRNTRNEIYVLNFTADENFTDKSYKFIYMPKDADVEKNLNIKISPKGLNKYNK